MKILIIGGGGREHALAWRLHKSPSVKQVFVSPGNPGIAQIATCLPAQETVLGYANLAKANGVSLTIVGPEAPLVAGIVDEFYRRRLKIVGPTKDAAKLEGSKIFAKQFFQRASIPTAKSIQASNYDEAVAALTEFTFPLVIKADGLHAGKGVIIAQSQQEAIEAIQKLGPALVIEEFLQGEEVSLIGITNGSFLIPFAPSQDHKRIFDNDQGPNTGGMGAYTDGRILTTAQTSHIMETIILPTLRQMRAEGTPYAGFLYAGLMMTADGPKILEYNVRMGDPETQAIMHGFHGDFVQLLELMTTGMGGLKGNMWGNCSVCLTLAAANYPSAPRIGDLITGIADAEATGATVFHAGTKLDGDRLLTNGGRVLSVTATAETLPAAIGHAYLAASKIHFDGMQYRTDIGKKGLVRW